MYDTSLPAALDVLNDDAEFAFRARLAENLYRRIRELPWSGDPLRYLDERAQREELHRAFEESLRNLGLTLLALLDRSRAAADLTEHAQPHEPLSLEPALDAPEPIETGEVVDEPSPAETVSAEAAEAVEGPVATMSLQPDEAPSPAVTRPAPPVVALSMDMLSQLQQKLRNNTVPEAARPAKSIPTDLLLELKARVGSMRSAFADQNAIDSERGHLRALTQPEQMAPWLKLPEHLQVALVELLAARARTLQQEANLGDCPILRDVFSALSGYCREHEPGFAHGLARNHQPRQGESWRDEALERQRRFHELVAELTQPPVVPLTNGEAQHAVEAILDDDLEADELQQALLGLVRRGLRPDTRIARLLAEHVELLDLPELKPLRKAVKEQQRLDEREDEDEDEAPRGAAPWPYEHLTRGKIAALVGGDPREDVRERLQRRFGFAELDWIPGNKGARRIQALADKVDAGSVDIVFILVDFVRHAVTERLRTDSPNAMVIHVPSGYGLTRLRRGVEQAASRQG